MTIKEAEARTGLTRANIRYYEGEGFFSALRGENGYRNYSEDNIDTLLKLKLLRQLGLSLEEIHALQSGDETLERALERREAGLAEEEKELGQAARLCQELRSDRADFATLDARRYLDRLFQEETVLAGDQIPRRPFYLRRTFARGLDCLIWETVCALCLTGARQLGFLRDLDFELTAGVMGLVLMFAAETLLLHFIGTTPGKALLGLKIVREDGSLFTLGETASRTLRVTLIYGASVLIGGRRILGNEAAGFAGAVSAYVWYRCVWRNERNVDHIFTPWMLKDELYLDGSTKEQSFGERKGVELRVAVFVALTLLCAFANVKMMQGGGSLFPRTPDQPSPATAVEFAENYNEAAAYWGGATRQRWYLTGDGTFEERIPEGTDQNAGWWGWTPMGKFEFQEKNGRLSKILYREEYDSLSPTAEGKTLFAPFNEYRYMISAFLGNRLSDREINDILDDLYRYQWNYTWEDKGVQVKCETFASGYELRATEYLAQPDQRQQYSLKFTMAILDP